MHSQLSPLAFHTNRDELTAELIEGGGKAEKLAGSHYGSNNGIGWRMGNMGIKENYPVGGRIGIDT